VGQDEALFQAILDNHIGVAVAAAEENWLGEVSTD
jgi:hypothetical protein